VTDRREQAALLALTEVSPAPWHEVADLVEDAGSVMAVVEGTAQSYTQKGTELLAELVRQTTPAMVDSWISTIEMTLEQLPDASLITVLDPEYPENLRRIYNRPPFLFVRGHLIDEDNRSVAVVGTRRASPEGRKRARFLATALAQRGVTVVSGLAAGIDTSAHSGALDGGGRTVAVMGTGIDRTYPAENAALAERIAAHGALISQFWPGTPPRATNFPLRNVVTSGMAVGTVVIEASGKSGARMQARLALEHGKRVLLMKDLVMQEEWAQLYERRGAKVVESVEDILAVLDAERSVPTALQLF
jgi:DNA processing protein